MGIVGLPEMLANAVSMNAVGITYELIYGELLENYCVELLCVVVREPLISTTQ